MKNSIVVFLFSAFACTNAIGQSVYTSLIQRQIISLKEETRDKIINSIQEENRLLKSGSRDVATYKYVIGECKPQIAMSFSAYDKVIELAEKYKDDEYKLKMISRALEEISYVSHHYYSGSREVKVHLRSGRAIAINNLYSYVLLYE